MKGTSRLSHSILLTTVGLVACGNDRALGAVATTDAGRIATADAGRIETVNETTLRTMPRDSWLHVPAGYMAVCDDTPSLPTHGTVGCRAILNDSSAVWANERRQLLLFGGGGYYLGNEVYAFDVPTFTWKLLSEPSPPPYTSDPLADGAPLTRQTFSSLVWLAPEASMFVWGGSAQGRGLDVRRTYLFAPSKGNWTSWSSADAPTQVELAAAAAFDPSHHRIVLWNHGLYSYSLTTHTWQREANSGYPPFWPGYAVGNPTGAVDTKRGIFWAVGGQLFFVFDMNTNAIVTEAWMTSGAGTYDNAALVAGYPGQHRTGGGGDIIGVKAPGLDYDERADRLVAWVGGAPYLLDLTSKAWTRSAAPTGAPVHPNGVFGRFRYLPEYDVFLLVTDGLGVDFYKAP